MPVKVKILVSYHKDCERLQSDIFVPVHVGRALASGKRKKEMQDMIGDDTGDHISWKNPNYCELTAQYWAWKNWKLLGDPDYIGFMHYRRHLNFSLDQKIEEDRFGLICRDFFSSHYWKEFGLEDQHIAEVVSSCDIVVAKKWDVTNVSSKNNYDHYQFSDFKLHVKDYDRVLQILLKKYPEYSFSVQKYNESKFGYYTNIFIMKKELFWKYSDWLFDILFELEKQLDLSQYDTQEARVFGYISEWLFGIFLTYQMQNSSLKVKELQRTMIRYPEKRRRIPICFSSDDNYAPHLGVAIASILKNKEPGDDFVFYILDGGISAKNKEKLLSLQIISSFILKFLKINPADFQQCIITESMQHISLATYYRFFIPSLIREEKVLYLDCDLVVRGSLGELFEVELSNYYFSAVIDLLAEENGRRLQLERYCNCGVMLINNKKWRDDFVTGRLFQYLQENSKKIVFGDQDVLNVVLQSDILYLDPIWNIQTGEYRSCYDSGFNSRIEEARILHFVGRKKPWSFCNKQPAKKEYFKYLRYTPWDKFSLSFFIKNFFHFLTSLQVWTLFRYLKRYGVRYTVSLCWNKLKRFRKGL